MRLSKKIFHCCTFFVLCACSTKAPEKQTENTQENARAETPELDYVVTATLPHDTTSYTQGLLVYGDKVLESTGSPENLKQTRSVMGILDLKTGKIEVKAELDRGKFFGEGIAVHQGKIYQLTWLNQKGFVYDARTFRQTGEFTFSNKEGWGLTSDGHSLIMSDGSNKLSYVNAADFTIRKSIDVMNNGYPETYLNELEFINGFVYANVYNRNYIVKIDTTSGQVVAKLDLSSLVFQAQRKYRLAEVLNGIAYDEKTGELLVTGKLWPLLYRIKVQENQLP
jgi:glutamine cyclotransferase